MKNSNYIKIFINGQTYILSKQVKLNQLMDYFNSRLPLFILEYNGLIYNQTSWNKIILQTSDKIEIITVVGGG